MVDKYKKGFLNWHFTNLIMRRGNVCLMGGGLEEKPEMLNISRAPEPNDIIWENLDRTACY